MAGLTGGNCRLLSFMSVLTSQPCTAAAEENWKNYPGGYEQPSSPPPPLRDHCVSERLHVHAKVAE